jgi:small ligand-binding sensory domain FIST
MTGRLKAAQATGDHWGTAAKACLAGVEPLPEGSNVGFLYVTEGFAEDLSSIVTFLKETSGISDWLGAAGYGVFGPQGEVRSSPALALMVGRLADGAARPFDGFDPAERSAFLARHAQWLADQDTVAAVVHGDPKASGIEAMVGGLADTAQAFLVGGLTAAANGPMQVCRRVTAGGLSGALLGDRVRLATGLTQGCSPIGRLRTVTEAVDNVVMRLDGQPALDLLKHDAGDIIARDLKRAAGFIHVALPVEGSDSHDYVVRSLLAIDPERGWLAVGQKVAAGDRLMFVRRDPNTAQKDMRRMLTGLAKRVGDRRIEGGLYFSCVARGAHMFGYDGREIGMIHEVLGDFPLVGFAAAGEICRDRLYGFTGVLTLFL